MCVASGREGDANGDVCRQLGVSKASFYVWKMTYAQLVLSNGTPRLYIMRLSARGLAFDRITRHVRVTQCLAAMGEREWLLAVAPPLAPDDLAAMPDPATIKAFRISGALGIKLHRGTWHAGPFFDAPTMDFLNLELADTNEADHVNCHLARDHGVSFRFEGR